MAQIVKTNNPLFPIADRHLISCDESFVGKSLLETFQIFDFDIQHIKDDCVVLINDEVIDPINFTEVFLEREDIVNIRAIVRGGGGSNVLSTVLMIALVVASFYLGPEMMAFAGFGTAAEWSAAVMIGGSLLINSVFGPAMPHLGQPSAYKQLYQITGSSNQTRLNQPMPIVYGTMLMAPDVGANPYITFENNQEYLYEIFNFGYSNLTITNLGIGGTPIGSFQNVTTQWSTNGALTLFPSNVVATTGAQLTSAAGPITRTTELNTTAVGIDLRANLFKSNSDGSIGREDVSIHIQYKLTTSGTWSEWFGPGDVGPSISYQYGQYWLDISNDSTTPVVRTLYKTLPAAGQYDIRITRITHDFDDATHYGDLYWVQMKSYQPDNTDYAGQTRLAVKILANAQLNGTISQLQATVSAQCPVYNSVTSTWTTQATSNPAWWYLWFARGQFDANGVRIIGAGLPDARIDIAGIIEWAAWCDANSLSINYIEFNQVTVGDELALIARCGRAAPTWSKGILGAVWEQEGLPVTQMFGMSNIKKGSFQVSYLSDNLAQQINVQFLNQDLNYAQDVVHATVPGVTAPEITSTIFLPGVTSKTQAAQEAMLQAAAQTYFRRRVTFETDIEGLCSNKGDVVAVSHDLASWSYSGRLVSGTTTSVVLDREVTISSTTQPYLMVRHPDGTIDTVEVQKIVGTSNTLTLINPLTIDPNTDTNNSPRDYIYSFDPAATPGRQMKIMSVEPLGNNDNWVRLTLRDENPAYYAAATSSAWSWTSPTLSNQGQGTVTNITFSEVTNPQTGAVTVNIDWILTQAVGAKLSIQLGAGLFVDYGIVYGQHYSITVPAPTTMNITLTPVSVAQTKDVYAMTSASYTMVGLQILPENVSALIPNVTGLQIVGDAGTSEFVGADAKFQWRLSSTSAPEVGSEPQGGDSGVSNPYFRDYQVTISNLDGSVRRVDYTQNPNYIYTYEMNSEDEAGTPTRSFTIKVVARGQQNQLSTVPAQLTVSNPAPSVPTGITLTPAFTTIGITFNTPSDTDYAGVIIKYSTNIADTYSTCPNTLDTNTNNATITGLLSGITYYFFLAPYDAFGKTSLNVSSQYSSKTVLVTTVDLGPGSVTNIQLAAAAVETSNIASLAVTNALLAAGAVATLNLQSAAVTNAIIAPAAVTGTSIAANSILASHIVSGTITTTQIASNTIVGGNIAGGTITGSLIAGSTIAGTNIIGGTITGSLIAANTIDGTNIAAATITGGNIAALTIAAGNIASNTITAAQIAANTITAAELNVLTLSSITANIGTLTAGTIQNASGSVLFNVTDGLIVMDNGTTMSIKGEGFGASNQFLEWAGPSQSPASNYAACTTANATSYLTVSGQSYFGGNTALVHSGISGLNGYIKFPPAQDGTVIIEQWGTFTQGASSPNTVTFTIPFPNNCMNVTVTPSGGMEEYWVGTITTTGFQLNFGAGGLTIMWRAIGY